MIVADDEEKTAVPQTGITPTELPSTTAPPINLPAGSAIQDIAFVTERAADQVVVLEFHASLQRRAILVPADVDPAARAARVQLSILTIPTEDHHNPAHLAAARTWLSADPEAAVHLMTLQGAQILWCDRRVAALAQPERIDMIRAAMIESAFYDSELLAIEHAIGQKWPQLEADTPLAFEFNSQSMSRRQQLLHRFQEVVHLRMRLSRLSPLVHSPHIHPATLASQVGERFRERTRMAHRHESLSDQLEVFEKTYESCGQRVSDFVLNRQNTTLEWVIIVLLVAQVLLGLFEYLTRAGQ